ncbi:MAG: hypothetical protein MI919_14100, partial [Holophagales bacterium]|nr:hypothetical protein [Holophagales bacterium]
MGWTTARWGSLLGFTLLTALTAPAMELEPLVLALELGQQVLSHGLPAHAGAGGEVLLPLGELASLLELAITVDGAAGTADGFILAEARTFHLDLGRLEVTIEGRTEPVPAHAVHADLDELYIAIPQLVRWLPVELRLDRARSTVEVRALEPLPGEARALRQKARARLRRPDSLPPPPSPEPPFEPPFRTLDWPVIDLSLGLGLDHAERSSTLRGRLTLAASADLLGLTSRLLTTASSGSAPAQTRLSLGRRSAAAELWDVLPATELVLGDLTPTALPLAAATDGGHGLSLSSFPLDRPVDFDRMSIDGETLPGWEVELYGNGALLDFQLAADDGGIHFADVPLTYGLNRFELRSYGPHGEMRRQVRQMLIGPGLIRPGRWHYRLVAMQPGPWIARTGGAAGRERAGRLSLELERGMNRHLSLRGAVARIGEEDYRNLGLCLAMATVFSRLDLAADRRQRSLRLAVEARVAGLDLSLGHSRRRAVEGGPGLLTGPQMQHSLRAAGS